MLKNVIVRKTYILSVSPERNGKITVYTKIDVGKEKLSKRQI